MRATAFRNGAWVQLQGAVVKTNSDNRYNVGIRL